MPDEKNILSGDVPLGFGMALAQNIDAMRCFGKLTKEQQQSIIARTKNVKSKKEMRSFVDTISGTDFT